MSSIVNPLINDTELHFEHELWSSELAFWQDELKSFELRMKELKKRWTRTDVLEELEAFRQRFDEHHDVIDTLTRFIRIHEQSLARHRESGDDILDRGLIQQHINYSDLMYVKQKEYRKLKKRFFRFLARYM